MAPLGDLGTWIEEAVANGGYLALCGLIVIENLFPPIPSEVILPVAGYYVERGVLEFVPAVIAATIGSLLGALILFELGRRGGRPAVYRQAHRVRVSETDLERADEWFERYGGWVVLFGRVVPGVRSLVSIPAGLSEMSVWRFAALTTLGSAVWNTVLIAAGWALGANFGEVEDAVGAASDLVLAIGVVLAVVGFIVLRRRRRNRRRADEAAEDRDVPPTMR